ncbi:N-lysine methyltransferase KMT5A isoform X2 [Zootermopsis nevadensis]|uniref:N-lysine methyltransferase KMT5A isoform X2 n=1 Tax=Zootermopsis nevadensis TaxID=136037 RepID=UPI000B8E30BB|nr:N-lysine methyltransferase KMT5A isoform X2 [Zootermopsis nevadensis]
MVRGRRKYNKGRMKPITEALEDASSGVPKKKDSKLSKEFQGKLSHASPQIRTPSITKFFSSQGYPDRKQKIKTKLGENVARETPASSVGSLTRMPCADPADSAGADDGEEKFVPQPVGCSPHKIQLCKDITSLSPSSALSQLCISLSPKRAVKSRRRLNPSQTLNQQYAPKIVPKLNCCNGVSVASGNHKLTEYFPVRRSVRKTKTTVLEEQQRDLEEAILSQREDGLEVHNFEGKGRGIVTTRLFSKGEFVVEYAGELIDICEAKEREKRYAQDQNTGCYMYYFNYRNNQYCVDATAESGRLGRLVNHSRSGNLITKTVPIANQPHLVLIAKDDIPAGEEVMYDYGDRSKESIRYHPWLAS